MWWLSSSSSSLSRSTKIKSNLERFLQNITPNPPSQSLPQSCIHDLNSQWQPAGKDTIEYFTLGDLWDCYDEWSAYGAGTQVELSNGETVTQYYVPYLSAMQIYTNKSSTPSRNSREDNDVADTESDLWSDDSGSDQLSRSLSNNSSKTWDAVSEDSSFEQESSLPSRDKFGNLYFQYSEMCSPYWRVPLADKMAELSRSHPGLMSLRSVDISPASWMAVAWYPIYHIPAMKNEEDLSTCFLSYHTLSSSFQDCNDEFEVNQGEKDTHCWLSPFGLATYKMQGNLWVNPKTSDHEKLTCLHNAADSWLKQLNIHHHDYNFFNFHSTL